MLRTQVAAVFFFTPIILALPGLAACSRVDNAMNTPDASPSPGIPHDASTAGPDIVITPAQSGQVIQLSRGQIIRVAHPGLSAEWQVDYASEIIEALTPPEKVRSPGPDGWRFRAIAPGQTDLVLTSIPEPCPEGTPCPPMTARFVFTIDVK